MPLTAFSRGHFYRLRSPVLDGADDLLSDVLMAGNGGVAVQLGLSIGNGDVVDVVDFGQLLLELVELAEVIAPAGQQGNGVGGTDQQDLGVRVQGADGFDDGADV